MAADRRKRRALRYSAALLGVLTALLLVIVPGPNARASSATTLYVDDDDPTCGGKSPCYSSIQAAIDAAVPGDSILVEPGIYVRSLTFNGKSVAVQSTSGPEVTVIQGDGGTAVAIGPGGELIGFTVTGGAANFGAGMAVHGTGSIIKGNIFDGNAQGAGGFGAAIAGNSASPTIEQNIFRNNTCDDQHLSGVVSFVNSSSPRIINNVFEDNPCRAINLLISSGASDWPYIVMNNTIAGNPNVGIFSNRAPGLSIVNNIVAGNGSWGIFLRSSYNWGEPAVDYNNVWGNTAGDYGGLASAGPNDISADPLFADPMVGDYHLQPGSPAIDAGTNEGAPDRDFEGDPRPVDGDADGSAICDIGAYEFGAAPTPVAIDIKPGGDPNSTNLGSQGVIPVAILTTASFDATTVDPATVDFEGASALRSAVENVDNDSEADLIMHFRTQDTNIAPAATEACLTGETFGGEQIEGCDSVRIVPPEADADGDSLGVGLPRVFGDDVEATIGTDQFSACGSNAWPPDMNDDQSVNILDVFEMFPFWLSVSNRHDLNADGPVNILDVFRVFPFWLSSCT